MIKLISIKNNNGIVVVSLTTSDGEVIKGEKCIDYLENHVGEHMLMTIDCVDRIVKLNEILTLGNRRSLVFNKND